MNVLFTPDKSFSVHCLIETACLAIYYHDFILFQINAIEAFHSFVYVWFVTAVSFGIFNSLIPRC